MEQYHWARLAERVLPADPRRVLHKAFAALGEELSPTRELSSLFAKGAKLTPDVLLGELTIAVTNPEYGYKLAIRGFTDILIQVPVDSVLQCVAEDTVARAKVFASSLPRPYINERDDAIVPPLTEAFLERFGNDKKVIHSTAVR